MSLTVQYILLALIGLCCLLFVVRSQLPGVWRRLVGAIALWAAKEQHPTWLQSVGRRMAPPARAGNACAGCSNDDGCH
jgi:hypothetical protein